MFNNKKLLFLFLIFLLGGAILATSAVSAEDLNITDSDILSEEMEVDDSILENQLDDSSSDENDSNDVLEVSDEDSLGANYKIFKDIQEKIDSANSGDTVYIENGTYYGFGYPLVINKQIKLVGLGDGVVLRANTNTNIKQCAIYINSSDVTVENFNITYGCFQWGGGVYINCLYYDSILKGYKYTTLYKNITISNCLFKDNSADGNYGYGGAICLWADNSLVINCTFINNHCTDYGGAIYINGEDNTVSNSQFSYNYISNELMELDGQEGWRGGGAIYSDCKGTTIDNCTFEDNSAREANGGALKLATYSTVKNCNFKSNIAAAAKDVYGCDDVNFRNNIFLLEYKENETALFENVNITELTLFGNVFNKTKHDSSVSFSAGMIFEYATSGSIMVTVDGGSIDESSIKIINHPEAKITLKDNVITISNLAVGKYTLRVTTIPDDDHYSVESDLSVTVKKATAVIKASSTTVALKKGTAWTITLVNSKTGKVISNMKLTLKIYTGKKYKTVNVNTNANGVATFKTGSLAKGNHKVVVSGTHAGYTFNTLTSSIKVIKPKALTFKIVKKSNAKKGSLVTFQVLDKKTKKGVNGVKVQMLIYTGKTYKTIDLKTKTVGKKKGIAGIFTNEPSVGKHTVKIIPSTINYSGSGKTTIVIKASAKKGPSKTTKT